MASPTLFIILPLTIILINSMINFNTSNATPQKTSSKFPAILVFGDSTVDTGNNNFMATLFKANHVPYGQDYPNHVPTGRFSNGKLIPDILASLLGVKDAIPPFLDPNLTDEDLRGGVCFASAGSGYDDLSAVGIGVIPVSRQLELFQNYVERIKEVVGEEEAIKIVNGALVIISAGTNDFSYNFYGLPTRKQQFDVSGYQDFLQNKLQNFIKELYNLGGRQMLIAGLPPMGCLPTKLNRSSENDPKCIEERNSDSRLYNYKLVKLLNRLQALLPGTKLAYADIYSQLIDMMTYPQKYGFVETKRGCCGTGRFEAGPLCNLFSPLCGNASQHLFWDSIHPTQSAYQYISNYLQKQIIPQFST